MTHFWSGLVSWMNRGTGYNDRRRAEFEIWAKTEYKNDWQYAYNHMLQTNGQPPKTTKTILRQEAA
jgi:hypothetical protein